MADGGDCSRTAPGGGRTPTDRERFLTFALTAADMLLERDGRHWLRLHG